MAQQPVTPSLTGNPGLDSIIGTALISASTAAAVWIASTLKITDPNSVAWIGAAVLAVLGLIATGFWRWLKGTQVGQLIDLTRTQGVAAGINLTVQGKALADDGKTVVSVNDGTTPPLPPTIDTAKEIVTKFGPTLDEVKVTEALNASQFEGKSP